MTKEKTIQELAVLRKKIKNQKRNEKKKMKREATVCETSTTNKVNDPLKRLQGLIDELEEYQQTPQTKGGNPNRGSAVYLPKLENCLKLTKGVSHLRRSYISEGKNQSPSLRQTRGDEYVFPPSDEEEEEPVVETNTLMPAVAINEGASQAPVKQNVEEL
ncbi:hypothetical protein Taro_055377, partial [Colocasia esculenta]|nr:hypothetical protein [Colocasia esculenta]